MYWLTPLPLHQIRIFLFSEEAPSSLLLLPSRFFFRGRSVPQRLLRSDLQIRDFPCCRCSIDGDDKDRRRFPEKEKEEKRLELSHQEGWDVSLYPLSLSLSPLSPAGSRVLLSYLPTPSSSCKTVAWRQVPSVKECIIVHFCTFSPFSFK